MMRHSTVQPGDILADHGGPFKAKLPAINAAKRHPGTTHVPVRGGFVVRKKTDPMNEQDTQDRAEPKATASAGHGEMDALAAADRPDEPGPADAGAPDVEGNGVAYTQAMQATADQIAAKWKDGPAVKVVDSIDSAPQIVQDAFHHGSSTYFDGTIYLFADHLHDDKGVVQSLMGQAIGHCGMRAVFGDPVSSVLDKMARVSKAAINAKMKAYGLEPGSRDVAVEGVLADMAIKTPELGWVKQATIAVRDWLRDNVPRYKSMMLSDAEVIRSLIAPAQGWAHRASSTITNAANEKAVDAIMVGADDWTRDVDGRPVKMADHAASVEAMSTEAKGEVLLKAGKVSEAELTRWKATPLDIHDGAVGNRYVEHFLRPGIVWTGAELADRFDATPKQIALYIQRQAPTNLAGKAAELRATLETEMAQAIYDGNIEARRAVVGKRNEWDVEHPTTPLRFSMSAVVAKVHALKKAA